MANPMNDPFGLEASGIPPELAAQYRGLTRQQAIMEAMMKQGMAPGGGAINTGKFLVAPSPLEGVAKALQMYAGMRGLKDVDSKMGELGAQHASAQAAQMADYIKQRNGEPAKPAIELPEDVAGPVRPEIPAVPGNPRQAVMNALFSTNPRLQAIAKMDAAEQAKKDEFDRAEAGRMARHNAPSGSAILGQEGANQRHTTPSGSALLTTEAANQRHVTPSGSTEATIRAMAPLRAAQERFYGTNTAANAAKLYDDRGIIIPGLPPVASPRQPVLPPDGAPTPEVTSPAEKAAYDAVAQNLSRGVVGSAPAGGAFTPSQSPPADLSTLSPKDRREVILAEEKARASRLTPEQIRDQAAARAAGTAAGKTVAATAQNLPQMEAQVSQGLKLIDDLVAHPGKKLAVGLAANVPTYLIKGTPGADFKTRLEQIQGQQFLAAYEALKGGGSITDIEGKKATAAISRMSQATSISEFDSAAKEYKEVLQAGLMRARQRAAGISRAPSETSAAPSSAGRVIDFSSLPK